MAIKKRIKTISRFTRELLAEGESVRVDFKRQPDGISAEDLVAFANSDGGGNILAGVDEQVVDNAQIGVVSGCDVRDATILQILNKAVGCIPPISIDVYIENLDDKPMLRIEVLSSPTRPHCTPRGIYCRRDGARNRPLHPSELLKLFLDAEASAFASRFEVAADRITSELSSLEASLDQSIQNMSDQLGWADSQLGNTESTLSSILGMVAGLSKDTSDVSTRLRALFRQDERDDPIKNRERLKYVNGLIKQITDDKDLLDHVIHGGQLTVRIAEDEGSDISSGDAKQLLEVAVTHVRNKEEEKKYSVSAKPVKECTENDLDQFASMVAEGGEVAGGIRARVERAHRLGFITYEGRVVGTAALKKPAITYRAKVFKKAKSTLSPGDFLYELGWIYLGTPHRKKGLMTRLLKELELVAKDAAIFATTRDSNEIMQTMLSHAGFTQDGNDYPSEQHDSECLRLFVRQSRLGGPTT